MLVNGVVANRQGLGFGEIKKALIIKGGKSVAERSDFFLKNVIEKRKPGTEIAHYYPSHKDRSQIGVIVYESKDDLKNIKSFNDVLSIMTRKIDLDKIKQKIARK